MKNSAFKYFLLTFFILAVLTPVNFGMLIDEISGVVINKEYGQPVSTARVDLFTSDGKFVKTTFTDEDGVFHLFLVDPGTYYLTIRNGEHSVAGKEFVKEKNQAVWLGDIIFSSSDE